MPELESLPAISMEGVCKTFEGRELFRNFSLQVQRGEIVILLGHSGLGKTTLLRMMAGQTPFEGTIKVFGKIVKVEMSGRTHEDMAYITQQPNLWSNLSAVENIALVRKLLKGENAAQARETALAWLKRLDLEAVADQYPQTLSGGEQQRVSIARGLAAEKDILLLDEVTSNIDPDRRQWVADTLKRMAGEGKAIVLVTHDLPTANLLSDWAYEVTPEGPKRVALG